MEARKSYFVVTGASSGFGLELINRLLSISDNHVIVGGRPCPKPTNQMMDDLHSLIWTLQIFQASEPFLWL